MEVTATVNPCMEVAIENWVIVRNPDMIDFRDMRASGGRISSPKEKVNWKKEGF